MKKQKHAPTPLEEGGAKQAIKEAAIKLFASQGLDGTSTRDIAKGSGLNLSLISYYFGGKENLYKTVIQEFSLLVKDRIDQLVSSFEEEEISSASLKKTIHALIDIMVDIRIAHPEMAQIMTREKLSDSVCGPESNDHAFVQIGERLESILARGQKHGLVSKKINSAFFFSCLMESIIGYFMKLDSPVLNARMTKKCFKMPAQREEFKNQLSNLFLEGILK